MPIKKHHFIFGGSAFLLALTFLLLTITNTGKAAPLTTATEGSTSCNVYDEPQSSGIAWAGNAVCTSTNGSAGCFMICGKTNDAKITCASGYEPYDTGPLNDPSLGDGWACAKAGTAGTQPGNTYTFGTLATPTPIQASTPTESITPTPSITPSAQFDYSKYFQQKTPTTTTTPSTKTAPSTKTVTPSTTKPSSATPKTSTPKTSTLETAKPTTAKPTSSPKTDSPVDAQKTAEEKPAEIAPLPKKETPAKETPADEKILEHKAADTPAETFAWKDVTEKTKGHKEIVELTNLMNELKNYRLPKNKLYKPKAKTKWSFAVQIALTVAGESCGINIEKLPSAMRHQFGKKNYAPCVSKALELGLIDETAEITKSIKRGDFYKLMLDAAKLQMVTVDAEENVCPDVKPTDKFAAVVASAKHYGIAKRYKVKRESGFCMPNGPLTKTDAAVIAAKTLKL